MRPRIFGELDGVTYEEPFSNSQEGWNAAWLRWHDLSTADGESGMITFEFCGHDETPVRPCSLVQRRIWGNSGEPNP